MFFERTVRSTIENINATFPVLLVTGPRQVGKSTLLESMMEPGRKKVSLDNPTIRSMAIADPELFLQRYSPPVLIDEAQYAPELFRISKYWWMSITPGRFLADRLADVPDDEKCNRKFSRPGRNCSDAGIV